MRPAVLAFLVILAACKQEATPCPAALPEAKPPRRTAMQDESLRVFLADIAAAKACNLIRGKLRALRDSERPDVATGVLWIKDCKIDSRGTKIDFQISGEGWQWAEETTKKAGATFEVAQYVRFAVDARIPGSLDIAYGKKSHVLSIWFSPTERPEIDFETIGEVEVDEQGAWSSILGALSAAVGQSPDQQGEQQAQDKGTFEFTRSFADGLSVTIDACRGLMRFSLGRPSTGEMVEPDVGETRDIPVELEPDGLILLGPYPAPSRMTAQVNVREGAVRAELYCHDDGEKLADAFLHGGGAAPEPLASKLVRGEATLRARRPGCDVVFAARPVGGRAVLDWKRPTSEEARAAGGPLIECAKR
jgi:hypothetical protein